LQEKFPKNGFLHHKSKIQGTNNEARYLWSKTASKIIAIKSRRAATKFSTIKILTITKTGANLKLWIKLTVEGTEKEN